jgi:Photosynthetic reaction centre cytochrome C subunit
MIRFSAVVAVCVLLVAGSLVSAQAPAAPGQTPGQPPGQGQAGRGGGAPQPPMTNLQVFPADTPRPQVVQTMQAFTQALGVTCAHCHVWVGTNDPTNDYATDMKPAKNVARAMIRMVRDINPMVQKAVAPKTDSVLAVNCMMCHRGAAIPTLPPPAAAPGRGPGGPGGPGAPGAPPQGTPGAPGAAGTPGAGRG